MTDSAQEGEGVTSSDLWVWGWAGLFFMFGVMLTMLLGMEATGGSLASWAGLMFFMVMGYMGFCGFMVGFMLNHKDDEKVDDDDEEEDDL